jgi:hypothetical protein
MTRPKTIGTGGLPLFDEAYESSQEAIDAVEAASSKKFLEKAYAAGAMLARRGVTFTSADIRDLLDSRYPGLKTKDDRALGAVMRSLSRDGVIEKTPMMRASGRTRNHNRPMAVWQRKQV